MGLARAGQFLIVALMPTVLLAGALRLPASLRWARRAFSRSEAHLVPRAGPPIEAVAANLRRLLRSHEALSRCRDVPFRARRLLAVEAAITDWAVQAADALGVPCPGRPLHGGLAKPELRHLLHDLAAAGLTLPPAIGLLASRDHS